MGHQESYHWNEHHFVMNIFLPLSSGTSVESVSSSFPAVDSASSPLMASKKLMQLSIVITQNVTKILLIYYIARDDMQQTGVCTKQAVERISKLLLSTCGVKFLPKCFMYR